MKRAGGTRAISGVATRGAVVALLIALLLAGSAAAFPAEGAAVAVDSWAALQEAVDGAENGAVLALSSDVTALPSDADITVPSGKRLVLDLNGHVLDRRLTRPGGAAIHVRTGAILTLRDSGAPEGAVTGGYRSDGGGIVNDGTLIMEGGRVTGNTALASGGGIANFGTMALVGGAVTGNVALQEAGGVYNQAKGHLTVGGDFVFDNSAPRHGDIYSEGTLTVVGDGAEGVRVEDMPTLRAFMEALAIIPALALLFVMPFVVWMDGYLSRERKRVMAVIVALVFSLILQNYLEYRLSLVKESNALRTSLAVYGYAVRPVILALFLRIVKPDGRYGIVWVMLGANAAVYLTAFFSGIAFHFSSGGHFRSGPLRHACTVVSALLYVRLFYLTMRQFHPRARRESWIPIFVTVLIGMSVAMDFTAVFTDQPISFLTIAIGISCVFYYIWLHLQFVREHEEALRAGQRIQIMMSQIQPHFLFNTLSTIQALCVKDPKKAVYAIEQFGVYLRKNLESLKQTDLIPLSRELEHTRAYAEIEALRFPNICVDYDVQALDVRIPALSIQPLVENAIRHGVRACRKGRVTVTVRREGDENLIVIRDNGNGFDPGTVGEGGGTHIGIANVRARLEQMCGGTLDIDSRIGEGTTVTMRVPAGE